MIAKQDNDFSDVTVQFLEVQALILVVIQLCQRNSGKMDEAGREVISFFYSQQINFKLSQWPDHV